MKRIGFLIPVAFILILGTHCASTGGIPQETAGFELALITDYGSVDDNSFIRGAWEGLVRYAREKNITHKYYRPSVQNDAAYLEAIDLAVRDGAKIIVAPGVLFETAVYTAQERYPDTRFILVDSVPRNPENGEYKTGNNTVSILYAEDQAGFLAGYAAVKDGYRRLGFMGGMAVPTVARFGYGFIQGIEYAAGELGLGPGAVTVNYHYTGDFAATPETQALAASWYNAGTEVVFAAGGAVGNSVIAAAEQTGKKVIGVDTDQSVESATVITSAMKGLRVSVYACIFNSYAGRFQGGQTLVFSAVNSGVGLPMETSKFNSFSIADYDAVIQKMVDGNIPRIEFLSSEGSMTPASELITVVTEFN